MGATVVKMYHYVQSKVTENQDYITFRKKKFVLQAEVVAGTMFAT